MVSKACVALYTWSSSHLVPVYAARRETVRKTSTVVQVSGIDQEKVDVFFLDKEGSPPPSKQNTTQALTRAISFMCAT